VRRGLPLALDERQANAIRRENQMTKTQLEQQCEGTEAQIRWAVLHGGDQELLDLLHIENDRLCVMMGQCQSRGSTAPTRSRRISKALSWSAPPPACRLQPSRR
jgi:Fe-S cluster biogenesis protein NfuA